MPISTFTILAKGNRTNFTGTRGPVTIPNNITRVNSIRIYVDSTNAGGTHTYNDPVNEHLNVTAQHSNDGVTFQDDFGFTSDGGATDRLGNPIDPEVTTYYDDASRPAPGTFEQVVIEQIGSFRFGVFADVDHD